MVLVFVFWIVALMLLIPTGLAFKKLLGGNIGIYGRNLTDEIFQAFVLGLFVLIEISMWMSLIIPMNIYAYLVVIGIALFGGVYVGRDLAKVILRFREWYFESSWLTRLFLLAGFIVSLVWSVSIEKDNGMNSIYHLQMMRWAKEFAVVPGLGNLNSRLGYNHSFLVLESLLQYPFQRFTVADDLNGLLMIVFCLYISKGIDEGKYVHRLGLVFLLPLGFIFIATCTPELSVAILVAYVIISLLEKGVDNSENNKLVFIMLCLTIVLVITIKLSALSLVLFGAYGLWVYWKNITVKSLFWVLGASIFIVLPWLIRFKVMTGYLIYPFYQLDFFNDDWKMPSVIPAWEQNINTYVARTSGFGPNDDWNIEGKGFLFWFVPWLKGKSVGYLAVLGLFVINFGFSIFLLMNRGKKQTVISSVSLIISISVLFWFIQSPNMRYIIGYGWGSIVLFLFWFNGIKQGKYFVKYLPKLATFGILGFVVFALGTKKYSGNLVFQAPYHTPKVSFIEVTNSKIAFPIKPDIGCWDFALPCSDTIFNGLEMRGESLKDGFRIMK